MIPLTKEGRTTSACKSAEDVSGDSDMEGRRSDEWRADEFGWLEFRGYRGFWLSPDEQPKRVRIKLRGLEMPPRLLREVFVDFLSYK